MYVHIGKDVVINSDNIISILDIESLEKNKKFGYFFPFFERVSIDLPSEVCST